MPFEISSFASDFFQDEDDCEFGQTHRYAGEFEYPTTLFKALTNLSDEFWDEYLEYEGLDPDMDVHQVMKYVCSEVNSCSSLSSPVEVHLSKDGWYTVRVWDAEHAARLLTEEDNEWSTDGVDWDTDEIW